MNFSQINLLEQFLQISDEYSNRQFCRSNQKVFTYGAMRQSSLKIGFWLKNKTLEQDDKVVICLKDPAHFVAAYFGALVAGAIPVTIDSETKGAQIENFKKHCGSKVVINNQNIGEAITTKGNIIFEKKNLLKTSFALILYTSGTEGQPKAVPFTHESLYHCFVNSQSFRDGDSGDFTFLNFLPFSHLPGFVTGLLYPILSAGTVIFSLPFNVKNVIDLLEETEVHYLATTPSATKAFYRYFQESNSKPVANAISIALSSEKAYPSTVEQLEQMFPNSNVRIYYSMTEAPRISYLDTKGNESNLDSVGKVAPGSQVKIINSNGKECPIGITGEIVTKGPTVMPGYYNYGGDNSDCFTSDGWLKTGDLGYFKENGFLFYKSRKKNLIKYKGRSIFPEEVEQCLLKIPQILEAAVIGVNDKYYGEVVVAFVKLQGALSPEEILRSCEAQLPRWKVPKSVTILLTLPRTKSGKINRTELRSLCRESAR